MKLSSARFDGNDRRHCDTVAKQFCYQFNRNRLSLDKFDKNVHYNHEQLSICHTCKPTFMRFVNALDGNNACTCGTTVEDITPPSGPTVCIS